MGEAAGRDETGPREEGGDVLGRVKAACGGEGGGFGLRTTTESEGAGAGRQRAMEEYVATMEVRGGGGDVA